MKSFIRLIIVLMGFLALSCSESGLTKKQLAELEYRAENGDVAAARQLADYYISLKMPLSPMEYKRLSESEDLTPREAKKLAKWREIEENYKKWSRLAEEHNNTDTNDILKTILQHDAQKKSSVDVENDPSVDVESASSVNVESEPAQIEEVDFDTLMGFFDQMVGDLTELHILNSEDTLKFNAFTLKYAFLDKIAPNIDADELSHSQRLHFLQSLLALMKEVERIGKEMLKAGIEGAEDYIDTDMLKAKALLEKEYERESR